ncbi:hypothetical protein VMT65_18330 [Nocardia sp. CDC153]|uniref:DUF7373 family lipoprotein n=1 Tax=Nocardia sp. CDC153 TaxID=3112167 RepID=UPI002DB816FC|nr:hypothetical protein [Nocardia sp. CDC153]MEC3955005.1 hypothetical protein [Nocardia sp. CDC153]
MLDMRHGYGRLRSARIGVRAAAAAVLAVSVLVSAGCGSESHAAEEQSVDLSKLDTGSYKTKPQDPTTSDPATRGRTLEGLRLGNILPLASEIDPTLSHNAAITNVFTQPNSFDSLVNVDHFADDARGFLVGFATSGRPSEDPGLGLTLTNAVMVFDSESNAASAASALARSGLVLKPGTEVTSLQSSQHSAAQIVWVPTEQRLASWYPTGKFVVFTLIDQVENKSVAEAFSMPPEPAPLALADKAIDVTAAALTGFQPTPPDKLATLPLDPDGMLRLTLSRPTGDATVEAFSGTFNQHGMLHIVGDPAQYKALFDKAGVDSVSDGAGFLVRAKDEAAARGFLDSVSASRFQHRIDPPAGLPIARCVKYHGPDAHAAPFHCYVSYGRYAATVWSQQQQDVYQRISAQYAILANNK